MRTGIRRVLIVLLSMVIVGCAAYLIWYYMGAKNAKQSDDEAKDIAKVVEFKPLKEAENNPQEPVERDPEPVVIPIDFNALREQNEDIYAWIQVQGTIIDYPVLMELYDDEYYLNHDWQGNRAGQGSIFFQAVNSTDFTDFNTVLYGHQMGGGVETMFHQLNYFQDEDFMRDNPTVVIYTPEHILTYRVFAAVVYDDRLITDVYSNEPYDRQAFLDSIYNSNDMRNVYMDDVQVTTDDRIITLSTCINPEPNHRLLVEAVLVDEK